MVLVKVLVKVLVSVSESVNKSGPVVVSGLFSHCTLWSTVVLRRCCSLIYTLQRSGERRNCNTLRESFPSPFLSLPLLNHFIFSMIVPYLRSQGVAVSSTYCRGVNIKRKLLYTTAVFPSSVSCLYFDIFSHLFPSCGPEAVQKGEDKKVIALRY